MVITQFDQHIIECGNFFVLLSGIAEKELALIKAMEYAIDISPKCYELNNFIMVRSSSLLEEDGEIVIYSESQDFETFNILAKILQYKHLNIQYKIQILSE
ncbi:hypothetical protein [Persicobacter sp. CCB-QB2]|nr:hypothetical protein [Persicobacter sp. CCB-QB2]